RGDRYARRAPPVMKTADQRMTGIARTVNRDMTRTAAMVATLIPAIQKPRISADLPENSGYNEETTPVIPIRTIAEYHNRLREVTRETSSSRSCLGHPWGFGARMPGCEICSGTSRV